MKKARKKKVRATKPQTSLKIPLLVFGIIALFTLSVSYYQEHQKTLVAQEKSAWTKISKILVLDAQLSLRIDPWWMRDPKPLPTLEVSNLLKQKTANISRVLHQYKDISPETKQVAEKFTEFRSGLLINGSVQHLQENGVSSSLEGYALDISFIPEETCRANLAYFLAWKPQINTLFIPAVDLPEKMLPALLFHELSHASRHNKKDSGGVLAFDSRDNMDKEEVEMHELSGKILNSLSHGEYYRLIGEILNRKPKEKRFEQVLASITERDIALFNTMFGCLHTEVASTLLAMNYTHLIGFAIADKLGQGMTGKVKVYRAFTRYLH